VKRRWSAPPSESVGRNSQRIDLAAQDRKLATIVGDSRPGDDSVFRSDRQLCARDDRVHLIQHRAADRGGWLNLQLVVIETGRELSRKTRQKIKRTAACADDVS
jgi:hypothetical protein